MFGLDWFGFCVVWLVGSFVCVIHLALLYILANDKPKEKEANRGNKRDTQRDRDNLCEPQWEQTNNNCTM